MTFEDGTYFTRQQLELMYEVRLKLLLLKEREHLITKLIVWIFENVQTNTSLSISFYDIILFSIIIKFVLEIRLVFCYCPNSLYSTSIIDSPTSCLRWCKSRRRWMSINWRTPSWDCFRRRCCWASDRVWTMSRQCRGCRIVCWRLWGCKRLGHLPVRVLVARSPAFRRGYPSWERSGPGMPVFSIGSAETGRSSSYRRCSPRYSTFPSARRTCNEER